MQGLSNTFFASFLRDQLSQVGVVSWINQLLRISAIQSSTRAHQLLSQLSDHLIHLLSEWGEIWLWKRSCSVLINSDGLFRDVNESRINDLVDLIKSSSTFNVDGDFLDRSGDVFNAGFVCELALHIDFGSFGVELSL